MSRRNQCFLHSSCTLGSGFLCIFLEFGVSWDAFSPCVFHCERVSGLYPVRVFSAHFSSSSVKHGPFPLCLGSGYQGPPIWHLGEQHLLVNNQSWDDALEQWPCLSLAIGDNAEHRAGHSQGMDSLWTGGKVG